jgi:antitoxin component YwqK of YwqJK toxin-antitoxin module
VVAHGIGKCYNKKQILTYEGGLNNKYRYGEGKIYDNVSGKIIYDGYFCNNKHHGKGKFYYDSGHVKYYGDMSNNRVHGIGTFYEDNDKLEKEVYNGCMINGKPFVNN